MKQEIMKQEEKFMEQQVEKVLIKWMLEHIHNYITSNYSKVDLYDIYVLERFVKKNDESLKEASRETCQNRRFEIDRENAMKILKSIESNVTQKKFFLNIQSKICI